MLPQKLTQNLEGIKMNSSVIVVSPILAPRIDKMSSSHILTLASIPSFDIHFSIMNVEAKDAKKQKYAGGSNIDKRFHILVVGRGYLVQKCIA